MRFQRFTFLIALFFCTYGIITAASSIDVRLSHNTLNKIDNSLYVDIDVRVDNTDRLVLAGQNYRIFYPTDILKLDADESKSQLSPKKYSGLQFSSILENVKAMGHGALKFDKDLGFANFSVELLDNKNGGEMVTDKDGWVTIATLKFDIIDEFEEVSMIWGRDGMSETYATAFVEIAEWNAPLSTQTVVIDEYIDFNMSINTLSIEGVNYDISVGPNPAVDFVEIKSDVSLKNDINLTIRDFSGKLIREELLLKGNNFYNIDVSDLQSASYILEMTDADGYGLLSHKVVVTR